MVYRRNCKARLVPLPTMKFSRTIIIIFVALSVAAITVFIYADSTKIKQESPRSTELTVPSNLQDSDVLTWNCEIPEYKPESILLTCADGGWMVHSISWSKWGINGAEGTGIFREKLCEPNCAEGEIAEEKVKVKLSDLAEIRGKFYLRTLDINTVSGKDFNSGRADGLEWDLMEFGFV